MKKIYMLLFMGLPFFVWAQNPSVETDKGWVQGIQKNELSIYLGIPFAQPPIGALRWKAPEETIAWEGVKDCTTFGPSAYQTDPVPFMFWPEEYLIPKAPISEDCLYLNVWTKKEEGKKKPVLVYIHGGGFRSGGGACPIYNGEEMAKKDVVVVTINYRVGLFGFMAHPELAAESPTNSSGNYAILDMIAALKWVQNNIEQFGGDSSQVTIAGQSAGSMAVNILCASPLAKGLFRAAIAESGAGVLENALRPDLKKEGAELSGLELQNEVGVSSINELRLLSPDKILKASKGLNAPYVDGYVLPKSVQEIYAAGEQNPVTLLMGWNKYDVVGPPASSASAFKARVEEKYGKGAKKMLKEYPVGKDADWTDSQKRLSADEFFGVQHYYWAKLVNTLGTEPVYMYRFFRDVPAYDSSTDFGAFHSSEIVYAYHNLHTSDRPWEPVDEALSDTMSTYWANFIKTSSPNGNSMPLWPVYSQDSKQVMYFNNVSKVMPIHNEAALEVILKTNGK